MVKYQVHFEYVSKSMVWVQRGKRTAMARTETEAINKVKRAVPSSFGHWTNNLTKEVSDESLLRTL